MAIPSYLDKIIAPSNTTFIDWVVKTNDIMLDLGTVVITTGENNIGDIVLTGDFTANNVYVKTITGGTEESPESFQINSEVLFTQSPVTFSPDTDVNVQGVLNVSGFGFNVDVSEPVGISSQTIMNISSPEIIFSGDIEMQSLNVQTFEAQSSIFDNISAQAGTLSNMGIQDPDFIINEDYSGIEEDDWFILKDVLGDKTVRISYNDLLKEISESFSNVKVVYVDANATGFMDGSSLAPFNTLEQAFDWIQDKAPACITVHPGDYYTDGFLSLPDNCSIVSSSGQYSTNIILNPGFENSNAILVGSGCYVRGFSFTNQVIDNLDNPSGGFAVAFRPGALIKRSPYIRDVSQISNYTPVSIAAPLNPRNSQGTLDDLGGSDFPNPLVGRGGGVLLADRSILNQNSIFPYMLAFGATPRSPNGIGYVAKNGAGINGISSISIFQRTAFYALNGGQITLNNSGTQFGDISMRASGFTPIVDPYETEALLITAPPLSGWLEDNRETIVNEMWTDLQSKVYTEIDEEFTRRDADLLIQALIFDTLAADMNSSRSFVAGLFDYKGDLVFDPNESAGVGGTLLEAFVDSFEFILSYIIDTYQPNQQEETMITGLIEDVVIATIEDPKRINFGSLIESLGHQFNLAGAGVNKNALPLNFRRMGRSLPASTSILEENGGRVRWSGADEQNNQYFARGLRINGRSGRLEGRPFTSSVRKLARRAANSRTF